MANFDYKHEGVPISEISPYATGSLRQSRVGLSSVPSTDRMCR